MEKKTESKRLAIRYDNDLTKTPLKGLSKVDLNIFMYLLHRCQGKGTDDVLVTLEELKKLTGYKTSNGQTRFTKDIYRMKQRMAGISVWAKDIKGPGTITLLNIFSALTVDAEKKILTVSVTKECAYLLNNNVREYTELEYMEYRSLGSIYSKHIYRQLRAWRHTGIWNVGIEEFRELICIPASYETRDIEKRILKKAVEELKPMFPGLMCEKVLSSKRGAPLKTLKFSFDRGAVKRAGLICPYCGKPLVEKVINGNTCWCHKDGWKDNAECKRIFNSVAEIKGYEETPGKGEKKKEEPGEDGFCEMPEALREKIRQLTKGFEI